MKKIYLVMRRDQGRVFPIAASFDRELAEKDAKNVPGGYVTGVPLLEKKGE